jgi:SNF2 family DNA or RNA helicase
MGIKELLSKFTNGAEQDHISWKVDPYEGIDFIFDAQSLRDPEKYAIENPYFGLQLTYLKSALEQGLAEKNSNGFTITSAVVSELGEDFSALFSLPTLFPGKYITKFEGSTGRASFSARLELILPGGEQLSEYSLFGPFLKLAEDELYLLSQAEWRALNSMRDHQDLSADRRGEYENNWLVFQLQTAKKAGMDIDLAQFNNLELSNPESIGVAIEELANGDLAITPTYGAGINLDDIKARIGQIRAGDNHCILRVKDKFVLLDEKRLEATQEILSNRRIPKDQVATFLKSPTAYLNAALISLDTGFSLRVHGAERFTHRYFGDVEKSGIDWFSAQESQVESAERLTNYVDTEEKLEEVKTLIDDAKRNSADIVEYEGKSFDISDKEQVDNIISNIETGIADGSIRQKNDEDKPDTEKEERALEQAVVAIDSNDEDAVVKDYSLDGFNVASQTFDTDNIKRSPYAHQEEGIHWLLSHLDMVHETGEPGGALLADDMGLGKTYMSLVAIAEWYRRCKAKNLSAKPVLIVAPLSLLENWQAEIGDTSHKSPFTDIVVLQSDGDLTKFKIRGSGRETKQDFADSDVIEDQDQIRYSLKVGGAYGSARLDMPSRLVLTTYQTLRDYQFSLSRIDWSVVAFDEAQNLKNPNALATRAAKGLKADFKLLATGTPVENTLKDFWCLMDTAVPGLLGAWQSFRSEYITPITSTSGEEQGAIKLAVGRKLRSAVGDYMLRRTKAEKLKGLPSKTIYSGDEASNHDEFMPSLAGFMVGQQLSYYDEIIENVKASTAEDKRGLILPSLMRLKVSSIHHDIDAKVSLPQAVKEFLGQAEASTKIKCMLAILKEIEKRQEKVLIFATTKAIQAYVCALVTTLFKIPVETINGETRAVATKRDTQTRKLIIDRFQEQSGFGVIVMSPVAAGVGLTIVGANNVIHLERHWNPAKEAQATDRVYRIGQQKDVSVYLPMALHPKLKSFDLQLNSLLANKVDLSDAVVAAPVVEASDLAGCF